jgi:hypothetical protein
MSFRRCFSIRALSTKVPNPPRLFDYATIRKHMKPTVASVEAIENAFGMLAKGLVDVPIPMHIGIHETEVSLFVLNMRFQFTVNIFLYPLPLVQNTIACRSRGLSCKRRIY